MKTTLETPKAELPKGLVGTGRMLTHVWPDEEERPLAVTIRSLCARGLFPHVKIGSRLYFNLRQVQAWIDKKTVNGEEA